MKIYKHTLQVTSNQCLELPEDAEVLMVQMQHGEPQLWFLFNEKKSLIIKIKKIYIIGTGHEFCNKGFKYLNTFQTDSGLLIWHVFEEITKEQK